MRLQVFALLLHLLRLPSAAAAAAASCPAGSEVHPLNASVCSPVVLVPSVAQRGYPAGNLKVGNCAEVGSVYNQWVCTLSGAAYGNGDHHVKVSSTFGTWSRDVRLVFDGFSNAGGYMGSWADRTYPGPAFMHPSVAALSSHYHLAGVPDYVGEWLVVMLPVHVVSGISQVRITDGSAADYRVYGRSSLSGTSWNMLLDVVGATYSSANRSHVSPAVQMSGAFDVFGIVVRRCINDSLSMRQLSFVEGGQSPGVCNPGTFEYNATHCMLCAPGTFLNATGYSTNAAACVACPAGTYAYSHGSWMCTGCPAGTYSSAVGATGPGTCVECPAGTYSGASPGGNAACLACEVPGFVNLAARKERQGRGSTECVLVPEL
jgi:hypothetical protein